MKSVEYLALLGALLGCCLVQETFARPPSDIEETARLYDFLEKYGYFDNFPSKAEGKLPSTAERRQAIRSMQRMARIPQTGEMDRRTAEMLSQPRCGVKDADPRDVVKRPGRRSGRFAVLGDPYKWTDKTDLTYKIMNYPGESSPDLTREQVDGDVRAAFRVWSDVTPLTFTEIHGDDADIRLLFGGRAHTRVPGDPPFDGPGGTLAHAFTPNSGWGETDGDVHLDDDETFTKGVFRGTNLFYTLAHEIGHALGMFHSDAPDSLMWPYDRGYIPDFKLPGDDISGIQSLYGPNPSPPAATTEPPPVTVNRAYCDAALDATAVIDNEYFMFGSGMMWRFDSDRNLRSPPEGQSPREVFPKFPSGVRAVYQEGRSRNVIVLKAKNYWVYEKSSTWSGASPQYQLQNVNPDTERDFPQRAKELGFPKSVTGVLHLADVGFSYLIKGKKVLTFDEYRLELSETAVKLGNVFEGISKRPTSAFFAEGFANVLVGQEYYRYVYDYKTSSFVALNGYPRNFAQEFLRCPAAA